MRALLEHSSINRTSKLDTTKSNDIVFLYIYNNLVCHCRLNIVETFFDVLTFRLYNFYKLHWLSKHEFGLSKVLFSCTAPFTQNSWEFQQSHFKLPHFQARGLGSLKNERIVQIKVVGSDNNLKLKLKLNQVCTD